jgi:outer membrane protein OmpA-like peptidoglycan-associated protein
VPVAARAIGYLVAAAILVTCGATLAQDVEGSQDHPLVGRYAGATIIFYKASDFDEAALLTAPHDYNALLERNATDDRSGDDWLKLEGRVTKIRYEIPAGRSSLEVIRNYQAALVGQGFATLFECVDKNCLTGTLQDPYLIGQQVDTDNGDTARYSGHARYILAALDRAAGSGSAGGTVYVAILVGEDGPLVTAFVEVVETKAMETGKIEFLDAGQMAAAISSSQSVNLYGLLFDFDSAALKLESRPTLDEIAKLLGSRPEMRLEIVGHTDNQGSAAYNQGLSERRAQSVVAALTSSYGISADRLSASGAGLTSPIAPNDTEAGRAKNRRVELIAR